MCTFSYFLQPPRGDWVTFLCSLAGCPGVYGIPGGTAPSSVHPAKSRCVRGSRPPSCLCPASGGQLHGPPLSCESPLPLPPSPRHPRRPHGVPLFLVSAGLEPRPPPPCRFCPRKRWKGLRWHFRGLRLLAAPQDLPQAPDSPRLPCRSVQRQRWQPQPPGTGSWPPGARAEGMSCWRGCRPEDLSGRWPWGRTAGTVPMAGRSSAVANQSPLRASGRGRPERPATPRRAWAGRRT